MLVLTRKNGERLLIGKDIWITITHIGAGFVKIGVDAPKGVNVAREELIVRTPEDIN